MNKTQPLLHRWLLVCFSFLGVFLGAEELTVIVEDRDLEMPLEGVTLTISSTDTTAETDADGIAVLELPEGFARGILSAKLPGYDERKTPITAGQKEARVALAIADVIEGKELVVERSVPGKTDEQPGVSLVMDSREMDTTSNIGLIEDVMSSISTLPGVGFTGGFNAQPSIRGGYPDEMGTVLDGVYILMPWHWGGAYSIFNPNMVDTAKMSHGIFSTRYGRAMSGLLEVTTIQPDSAQVRVDTSLTSISSDAFAQIPFNEKDGLFLGGKVTYLETLGWLNDELNLSGINLSETIPTMPFIRDFYAKGYFTPAPDLDITVNGFFGSDGIGISSDNTNDGIRTITDFDWLNLMGFAAANVKWMPTDNAFVHFIGAYNNNTMDIDLNYDISGTWKYSDAFLATYDGSAIDTDGTAGTINGETGYTLKDFGTEGFSRQTIDQLQGKLESDILIGGSHILSFGVEEVAQLFRSKAKMGGWQLIDTDGLSEFRNISYEQNQDGNKILNSSAFALWSFGGEQSVLKGELGIRGEHFYLWNDNFTLNTYPVADPRFNLSWVPITNRGNLDRLTITAGTGLFSMFPTDAIAADSQFGVKSFEVGPNRAWFQILGAEAEMIDNWSFRLEGYYKHYFNRLYICTDYNTETNVIDYRVKTDGTGYATGFDLMLRKKDGRYLDGYLSYSFVVAQYLNPTEPTENSKTTMNGEQLNLWYYPSFHRFHTLNLVLNWKPFTGFVITTAAALATGTPKPENGEITMYPVLYNGKIVERYRRTATYSSTSRTDISCPVDLRVSYSNYWPNSKIRWEYYIGAEDIFVNLYSPKGNKSFDAFTGKELDNSDEANFNIGIPMISVGFKLSY